MPEPGAILLCGIENPGKSAVFRQLTHSTGTEANFRGSTIICRRCRSA